MISRQRLRENITTAIHKAQGTSLVATFSLGAYQAIYGIQQHFGDKDQNLIEQLTTLPPGTLIGGAAYATVMLLFIGDAIDQPPEQDSKPYKGVTDSSTYKP